MTTRRRRKMFTPSQLDTLQWMRDFIKNTLDCADGRAFERAAERALRLVNRMIASSSKEL